MTSLVALLAADLVLQNARVWTADPSRPWVTAVAIQGERIAAAGPFSKSWVGPKTQVLDLKGKLVIPGFNDAHIHFLSGSIGLSQVDLTGACTLAEMQKRIAAFAKANPNEPWITGSGWEYYCFPDHKLPRKEDLDAVVADRPVFIRACDGHTAWANSAALRAAEITKDSKFEGYGEIVRNANGEPAGSLKEGAQSLVSRHVPPVPRARKLAALRQGMKLAASLGITSIQNAGGSEEDLSLYEELLKQNALTLRVSVAASSGRATDADVASWAMWKKKYNSRWLRAGAVKFMLDGVIESKTAAMIEPYADGSKDRGAPAWNQKEYRDAVARCDKAGLQIYTHAIGDRAVRIALDAYENAIKLNRARDARFRIEHIETIHPADLRRFARLGVIASMEPIHADPGSVEVWSKMIGPQRLPMSFAWRSIEKAGARLLFSSDWPACLSVSPMRGLHNAVNRRTIDGKPEGGWLPGQRLRMESALRAYTVAGAYASFEDRIKGRIAPGMLADLVVLSQDLFRIDPMKIHETKVELTIVGGKNVHAQ